MSMGKMDFESKAWAPWLENCIKGLFDADVKCIGMVAIMEDGVAQTAYYHASLMDKAAMKEYINTDILMDIIKANAGIIREILEAAEDE